MPCLRQVLPVQLGQPGAIKQGHPQWGGPTRWAHRGAELCHPCCPSKVATTACSTGLGFHPKYPVLPPTPSASAAPLTAHVVVWR